jgi:hypothetical protein
VVSNVKCDEEVVLTVHDVDAVDGGEKQNLTERNCVPYTWVLINPTASYLDHPSKYRNLPLEKVKQLMFFNFQSVLQNIQKQDYCYNDIN